MTDKLELYFRVAEGRIPKEHAQTIAEAMRRNDGERMVLTLERAKKFSSDPQRMYYCSVIVPRWMDMWFRCTGERLTKKKMHHWMMENVGKWMQEIVGLDGEVTYLRRSYMELSTAEAEEHHTKCRQVAAEHGEDIPEPNEPEFQPTKEAV